MWRFLRLGILEESAILFWSLEHEMGVGRPSGWMMTEHLYPTSFEDNIYSLILTYNIGSDDTFAPPGTCNHAGAVTHVTLSSSHASHARQAPAPFPEGISPLHQPLFEATQRQLTLFRCQNSRPLLQGVFGVAFGREKGAKLRGTDACSL